MEQDGNGYLKVRVTTVGGSVPTPDADVMIYEKTVDGRHGEPLLNLRTGRGGITPTVMLPAPHMAESLTPGAESPYGLYDIRITKNGFIPVTLYDVPIFDRVTSLQSVDLLPDDGIGGYATEISVDESGDGYLDGSDNEGGGYDR